MICISSNGDKIYCPFSQKECNPNCALLSLPFGKSEDDDDLVCCTLSQPTFGDKIGLFELHHEEKEIEE